MFEVSYLERFLNLPDAFTPALARKIVDLRTDPELNTHTMCYDERPMKAR